MIRKVYKKGSALLLSLLIISALLSSVLYISVFSIRQISQAKSVDNSIIAYYAAEASNEQAIYAIRNNQYSLVSELSNTMNIGDNASVARVVTEEVDKGILISLKKDEFYQFDMFNPNDLGEGSLLNHLSFSWKDDCEDDSWIELTSNEWDPNSGNISWGSDYVSQNHIKKTLLNLKDGEDLNNIESISGSNFRPNMAYQFRVKAMYCNIDNLQIRAYSSDNDNDLLPFKNIINIVSIGEYPKNNSNSNKQALNITLKKTTPLSGLFDYVIFSEKSLIKDLESAGGNWYSEEFYIAEPDLIKINSGVPYNHDILLVNGTEPYTCSVGGSIPPGLSVNNCNISGTPTQNGSYAIIIYAGDANHDINHRIEKSLFIIVQ